MVKPFSGPKEGRRSETSNKPESSEQFCSDRAFQNGRNPYAKRPSQSRGLAGKSGSKGCILRNPNPPDPPSISQVFLSRQMLSVPMPPIRPVVSSMGLYQDPQASISSPSGDGGTIDSIHRRCASPGGVQGTSRESCGGHSVPPSVSGFQNKPGKITINPSSSNGVSGVNSRHCADGAETPSGKDKKDSCGVTGIDERRDCLSQSPGSAGGENECYIPSDPTSPTIFSPSTDGTIRHTEQETSVLRGTSSSDGAVQGLMWWDTHMINWNGKSLLKKEVDLIIDSDASLIGWGATCQTQRTGGPWSKAEGKMHINCLELLAATFEVHTFLKGKSRMSVLLRLDNTTAVAYINNLGGTVSKVLVDLAKSLWMWCLERNIHIMAQHLPGVQNVIADAESRIMIDRSLWQLNPGLFSSIARLFGPIEMDLFASRLTTQCPAYFSWRPDPYAAATDAFLQDWSQVKEYANPPWSMIGRVLSQAQTQQAHVVLVAPVWKTQPWYPLLLQMLIAVPHLISHNQVMLNRDPQHFIPQLAVWNISGRDTETRSFRRKLPHSCLSHGGLRPTDLTTHSLASGIAGVFQGIRIPFQVL